MKTLLTLLISLFISSIAKAYTPPIGIPDPGNTWGAVHPIDGVVPSQPGAWPSAEAENYYYIDEDHASSTDSTNTYGYPDKPRKTIPEITYAAGAYIEIHNGPYSGGGQIITTFSGTSSNPCWVVGKNSGEINAEWIVKGTYVIFDGLVGSQGGRIPIRPHSGSSANHVCIRNSTFAGDGSNGNGSVLSFYGGAGNRFTDGVFYGNTIHDFGDDDAVAENDFHGITSSQNADRVWILGNTVYNMGGDSTQIGTASITDAYRVSNVYIGGNEFHSNLENAVDIKEADNVVISQNHCYDFESANTLGGVAVVIHNGPTNVWTIFNKIHSAGNGIVCTGGSDVWNIGNLIYDIHHDPLASWDPSSGYADGAGIHFRGADGGAIGNTIYDYDIGIQLTTGSTSYVVQNNILTARSEPTGTDLRIADSSVGGATLADYNLYESPNIYWAASSYSDLAAFQAGKSQEANGVEGDPLLISPPANMRIPTESPAKNAGSGSAAYDDYLSTFGVSIENDYDGGTLADPADASIGAFWYGSTIPAAVAPAFTVNPSITGTASEGQTLSGNRGTITGVPSPGYYYQWIRCDAAGENPVDIVGATSTSYTLAIADVGKTIRFKVTATNSEGSANQTSSQTGVVVGTTVVAPTFSPENHITFPEP